MAEDQEKFCLKWNDFESNLSDAFRDLREEKDFLDVTLVCEENQLDAHKVVLSACSPFFRDVLKRNPHKHPLLYLKDVRLLDMQALLTFMYQGEVNVAQSQLNSFLMIAEDLKVKGLTQDGKNKPQPESRPKKSEKRPSPDASIPAHKPTKVQKIERTPVAYSSDPISITHQQQQQIKVEEVPVVDIEEEPSHNQQVEAYTEEYDEYDDSYGTLDDSAYSLQDPIAQDHHQGIIRNSSGLVDTDSSYNANDGEYNLEEYYINTPEGQKCTICEHLSQSKRLIRIHLEGKHGLSTGYTCEICNVFHKTNEALRIHKRRKHAEKAVQPSANQTYLSTI